ncbi:MAG: hypothetical protein U0746_06130 [Gemmataceae bacterium]
MHTTRREFLAASLATLASSAMGRGEPIEPFSVKATAITRGPKHHFFGYYDKCPWDATGRYLLANEIDFADRQPKAGEPLTVGLVDLKDGFAFKPFDTTLAWCWQQGCMLQWMPNAADREVIYNSVADGRYVSVVRDIQTGKTRTLPMPVHFLRGDGKQAVTLDYDRLHRLRPGYGYVAVPETKADVPAPDDRGCYTLDLATGKSQLVVSLAQLAAFKPDARFTGAQHYVNHMQYNPGGSRFLFLHRWTPVGGTAWFTRMFVCNTDGSDLRLVADANMVSHFDWRDDDTILAWARSPQKVDRFWLYDLKSGETKVMGEGVLVKDGHCSYSPDRKWVLNDTYPDKDRQQTLMLYRVADGRRFDLNKFLSPPQFTGPIRCDLHPRFNRDATQVCIDSTHDGGLRQIYVLDVAAVTRS